MIERPYELLYAGASGLEKALVDVDGRRLSAVPAGLIAENIDPWKVQTRNLQHLAWSLGVTLWETSWTEDWKRQWLSWQGDFMSSVGTLKAIRMALAPNAYEIADVVRPPAGFYASPDLSAEEMDAWIRLMPQVRIKFSSKTGHGDDDVWFCEDGFSDDELVGLDDGPVLYGREAVLRRADGTETPLDIVVETTRTEAGQRLEFERVAIPQNEDLAFYAEADFADDDVYAIRDDGQRFIYSAQLLATNDREVTSLSLTPLNHGLTPLTPRYERVSDIGYDGSQGAMLGALAPVTNDGKLIVLPDGETLLGLPAVGHPGEGWASIFADDAAAGTDYVTPDIGAEMLADRVYLLDETVAGPMNAGVSFAGIDRVGIPVKTAEILVDLHSKDEGPSFYEDDNIVGESFATVDDMSHVDRALRAVNAGKTPSQTVLTSFEAFKPVTFGSVIRETTRAGEWLPALL